MPDSRRGYTLTEMLIVVVIVGGLTLFSLPRFHGLTERRNLAAAKQEISSAIATARAAAVQKGRKARVVISSGGQLSVTVDTSAAGGTATLVPPKALKSLYGVTVSATDSVISFDMRGFASPRLASIGKFWVAGTTRRDSVCVTTAGQIMPRGCAL